MLLLYDKNVVFILNGLAYKNNQCPINFFLKPYKSYHLILYFYIYKLLKKQCPNTDIITQTLSVQDI